MTLELNEKNLNILREKFEKKSGGVVHVPCFQLKENPELCAYIHNQEILIDDRLETVFNA